MDRREAESLRRRLYAPGATEEDRRRYAAVAPEEDRLGSAAAAPEARDARPVRRRRVPVALLVVAAVLVAAAGAEVTGRLTRPESTRSAAPRIVVTAPPSQPHVSGTFERVPVVVDGVAAVAQRMRGEGQAVVAIDTTSASFTGGSLVVVLSSDDGRPMGWEARRLVTRQDWTSFQRVVATSPSVDRRGTPTPVTKHYTGAPPLWIAVKAPGGAIWTLTVALTSAKASALH